MFEIRITVGPEGLSQVDLDTPRDESQEAESFYKYMRGHIQALHTAAKAWEPPKKGGDPDA